MLSNGQCRTSAIFPQNTALQGKTLEMYWQLQSIKVFEKQSVQSALNHSITRRLNNHFSNKIIRNAKDKPPQPIQTNMRAVPNNTFVNMVRWGEVIPSFLFKNDCAMKIFHRNQLRIFKLNLPWAEYLPYS